MIDNRLAEDVQMKLRSDHFFEPVHGRIYDAIMLMLDRNMVANPVTLKPMFEADEAIKITALRLSNVSEAAKHLNGAAIAEKSVPSAMNPTVASTTGVPAGTVRPKTCSVLWVTPGA